MIPHFNLTLPPELPISQAAEEIKNLIRKNQVVIICGDTGSGKTTQLPKLAMLARPDARGQIGCTQPRRLAAITMAQRVADELKTDIGNGVGYQHRFEKKISSNTKIKFMTDGILLSENRHDPLFKNYSTLIIDEAHERSLNIDFILGIIKRILPKRPDLRVVISSATLDSESFSSFFDNAPVMNIPGRLFPISVRWCDEILEDVEDLPRSVANAIDSLGSDFTDDILVFLPGERDIRDTKEMLEGRRYSRTEIIPLLASLPVAEQQRAFKLSQFRRIILATNVAETSVTIPGIKCVIDSGLARIKRYNSKTHVQQLKIEPISQASVRQRTGRCGRIAPGICIRLFTEDEYKRRDQIPLPEIRRSSLAGVILSMYDLQLGSIDEFPFIDPPQGAAVREGYRELIEIGAIAKTENSWQITRIGRNLMGLPVEPRFGRILFAAEVEQNLHDALTVVAALSCEDPRLRPAEKMQEADRIHQQFLTANSDFTARIKLWQWYTDKNQPQSQSAKRKRCKESFLSFQRMREWQSIREQLEDLCRQKKLHTTETKGGEAGLHRALLCGLLSRIGHKDAETGDYKGAFGVRFSIFPGSGLNKKKEKKEKVKPGELPMSREWIMAGELVDTSRLFARTASTIDMRWIEPIATQLCKYHRHSPFWDLNKGFVRVHEQVTLFGLSLTEQRIRDYTHINPVEAREIFIREALLTPDGMLNPPKSIEKNWQRLTLLAQEAAMQRITFIDTDKYFNFYDKILPEDCCNVPALRRFRGNLEMSDEDFPIDSETKKIFPTEIKVNGEIFNLSYKHAPDEIDDGVTCEVPVGKLEMLKFYHFDWLVPGLLPDKLSWMLTVLPNKIRRLLPLEETLAMLTSHLQIYRRPLADSVSKFIYENKGLVLPENLWTEDKIPDHLRMNFRVIDNSKKVIAESRNIQELTANFVNKENTDSNQFSLTNFTFSFTHQEEALIDTGDAVKIGEFHDLTLARIKHRQGLRRLFILLLGTSYKTAQQIPSISTSVKKYLSTLEIDTNQLGRDIAVNAIDSVFLNGAELRDMDAVKTQYALKKINFQTQATAWRRLILDILTKANHFENYVVDLQGILPETQENILEQLEWLVFGGFTSSVPREQLLQYPKYFEALELRLERAILNPGGDVKKINAFYPAWQWYVEFASQTSKPRHNPILLSEYRWKCELLRMQTFAPEMKFEETTSLQKLAALREQIIIK